MVMKHVSSGRAQLFDYSEKQAIIGAPGDVIYKVKKGGCNQITARSLKSPITRQLNTAAEPQLRPSWANNNMVYSFSYF